MMKVPTPPTLQMHLIMTFKSCQIDEQLFYSIVTEKKDQKRYLQILKYELYEHSINQMLIFMKKNFHQSKKLMIRQEDRK